ncbi:hypothetical protein U9M48_010287 [Paspalum notatum var. saurae]|uniref:RanBP2-type domain-containing protein n=1 Tax=Paspalum notatum var. saurae TaxID=547442 RepID=A0AAQ3WG35_PASNO
MASSRLLNLALSSSFLRSCRLASTSPRSTASRRHPELLLSLRFCSATPVSVSVDIAADPARAAVSAGHPWPEWSDFLEKLRAKGYFERGVPASGVSAGEGAAGDGEVALAVASDKAAAPAADNAVVGVTDSAVASEDTYPFRDLNMVKNACLKFARDRFDLLSSLPKQDIQAIVECGCPNTNRKPVNSAKRLREFVQFEEADACSICKFRGSCDKAYVTPKAEDGVRTVDVVRILLNYAIDTNLSGENAVNENVQESARKLLSELTALSDTIIDPSLPKPVFQTSSKQKSSTKISDKSKESVVKAWGSVGKGGETTAVEMKKGDWLCANILRYYTACAFSLKYVFLVSCNFLNFARNRHCLECKADGPRKIEAATIEMKTGDWICTQCHFMNFARNKICFKCEEPRPKKQLNPGEWECPSCSYVNFSRNMICKKCNQDRPEDDTRDNQLGFRKTRGARKIRSFDHIDREDDGDGMLVSRTQLKLDRKSSTAQRGFDDEEDGLLTAKRRSTNEDEDGDFLPYKGAHKHVASRRASLAQRRFTTAQK